ncbi:unnamed protein product [Fraxinus pennsylvanica]|uniref:Uncharacterized protein n=1 Tax=Fraxinus pennsylvanica TaxID=56036 RepID=A0AAD1ZMQ3_9LAMI|nr:unnamed protein product [Fraxinus pennsylvanica]
MQLSTTNMNSASCGAVKLESVDENPKRDCTVGTSTSSTMELSKLSSMKRELIESCSSETVVPSSSSSEKVVDPRPIKSEPFQECNKGICKCADSTVPQSVEKVMQHQESCASSSVLSMALTPQNSCPSLLPTFLESTTSEYLSNQSVDSFHTKNLRNRKDIPDEPINAVVPKLVSQKGKEMGLHCEKVENLITEDPERCKLNRVDEHPIKLCGNSKVAASDEEKTNMPIGMLEADTFGSDGIHAFANWRGIGKRRRDKEDDDYEDGCVDTGFSEPDDEDGSLQNPLPDEITEVGLDKKSSNIVSPEKPLNLSGEEHVKEGGEKEVPGEGATNGSRGKGPTLGEKAPDERTKEITLGTNDLTLPKAEASLDNKSYNNKKNPSNSSNNASNKSRIINLPRTSIAASPCKTVSIPVRLSSRSGKERYSDLEGEIQLRGNSDEIFTDGPKKFVKDRIQHQTLRNSRPSFIAQREFIWQVSRRKHASSIADIELDYNGYGMTPDNSALSGGRRKARNDDLPLLQHPSTMRIPPRGRDGPAMSGIPMHCRIPKNVSPSRCTYGDGSDVVGFLHNEKYIRELSDDTLDPGFTRPQTISRTQSPGPWSSPWRSPDGHQQLPHHRSPTMCRMGRMRFPDEIVGRRRESPTFMILDGNIFIIDGEDCMSGPVHSSGFHDVSSDERRKFGERRVMARSFRPASNSDNDKFRFHHVNDGPRPFWFRPHIDMMLEL